MADETERIIQERTQIMEVIEQQEAAILGQIQEIEKQIKIECQQPWYKELSPVRKIFDLMELYKRLISVKQNKHDKEHDYFETICNNAGYDPERYQKKKQEVEIPAVKKTPTKRTMSDKEKAEYIALISSKVEEWAILSTNFPEKGNLKKASIVQSYVKEPFKEEKREILEQLMKEAQDGE